jgi:murein DD-endopeptidase MepM/ murein hydrolase activator NlpD
MSRDAYRTWLTSLRPNGIEIIEGVSNALPGKIDDPDVKPGERIRAGGYGEDRGVYSQVLFAPEGVEPRTVHLGFDIFALAGADVFAPLNARVHSFKINEADGDYGPTIILQHAPAPGLVFHTLYGHLSRNSLNGLKPGAAFMAGERIGELGTRRENGGWSPHLHFQVILDIGNWRGDYPGVCKRSERDHWLAICPDPRPLLGIG